MEFSTCHDFLAVQASSSHYLSHTLIIVKASCNGVGEFETVSEKAGIMENGRDRPRPARNVIAFLQYSSLS